MPAEKPSIGILIPTLNCAALVPGHVESLGQWAEMAEEIVVVDSQSNDGTVELFKKGLRHPRVKFLQHPRGLYQSWNFGVQNVSAKYVYIATVGDSITRAGVEHLWALAEEHRCGVVISKPNFVNANGAALSDSRWPIDNIIERLQLRQPRLLSTAEQFLFAMTNTWGAILGSSASNLYRTECLKERPFPTQFGTAGDGGWGILNAFGVKIAVTPQRFSTFRYHEKAYALADYHVESLARKLFRLGQEVASQELQRDPVARQILEEIDWEQLEPALNISFVEGDKLEAVRNGKFPWFLLPSAWKTRSVRNRARRRADELVERALASMRK